MQDVGYKVYTDPLNWTIKRQDLWLKQKLTKENKQIAKKHFKKCLVSGIIREIQMKWKKTVEKKWTAEKIPWEKIWELFVNPKYTFTIWPENPLGIFNQVAKRCVYKKFKKSSMFTAAFFTRAQIGSSPGYL